MKPKETTCKDCRKWRYYVESSRGYPCIKFERKAGVQQNEHKAWYVSHKTIPNMAKHENKVQ